MNTLLKERILAIRLAKQATAVYLMDLKLLATGNLVSIPSKRQSKSGKRWTQLERQKHSRSMLAPHNTHPRPFTRVQGQLDDRTTRLLAAHSSRQAAGWIRG